MSYNLVKNLNEFIVINPSYSIDASCDKYTLLDLCEMFNIQDNYNELCKCYDIENSAIFENKNILIYDHPIPSAGLYALYKQNKIVYIGKSDYISNRVKQHADKDFDTTKSIIFKKEVDLLLYESYLITKYKPLYNKAELKSSKDFTSVIDINLLK